MKKATNSYSKTVVPLLLTGLFVASGGVQADQQKLPIGPSAENRQDLEVPQHGQSKKAVRARFGSPDRIKGPVGKPPISEWHYRDFVVYLERDTVIHTVIRPERQAENHQS
ncbi:MAG: hypothetical protein KGY54_02580 [Oleiphilaceae bacterium]|nr:hypothetical protein [Oleiphilaceae bacterium]